MDELDRIMAGLPPLAPASKASNAVDTATPRVTTNRAQQEVPDLLGSFEDAGMANLRGASTTAAPIPASKPQEDAWKEMFADVASKPVTPSRAGSDLMTHHVDLSNSPPAARSNNSQLNADLERWFAEADADGDGRIGLGEAREFFQRTGLPKATLSKAWHASRAAEPPAVDGLTARQFAAAMRVVAYAQAGHPLTDDAAIAAAARFGGWLARTGQQLPPPHVSPHPGVQAPSTRDISQQQQQDTSGLLPPLVPPRLARKPRPPPSRMPQHDGKLPAESSEPSFAVLEQQQQQQQQHRVSSESVPGCLVNQMQSRAQQQQQPRSSQPLSVSVSVSQRVPASRPPPPSYEEVVAPRAVSVSSNSSSSFMAGRTTAGSLRQPPLLGTSPLSPTAASVSSQRDSIQPSLLGVSPSSSVSEFRTERRSPRSSSECSDSSDNEDRGGSNSMQGVRTLVRPQRSRMRRTRTEAMPRHLDHGPPGGAVSSRSMSVTERTSAMPAQQARLCLTKLDTSRAKVAVPLCIEVRPPPLHPTTSAALRFLDASNGSLFAGPSAQGAYLQWGGVHEHLGCPSNPQGGGVPRASSEDADSAPAAVALLPAATKRVTAMHADIYNNTLFTGHADGVVSEFTTSNTAGSVAELVQSWPAFRGGAVTSLCATASGDLWCGNSRGSLRIWPARHELPLMAAVEPRELRRSHANSTISNRPHAGPITFLALPQSGQVMWSCCGKTICLWSTSTGAWLGKLEASASGNRDMEDSEVPYTPAITNIQSQHGGAHVNEDAGGVLENHLRINSSKGLEMDPVGGLAVFDEWAGRDDEIEKQRNWAQLSDRRIAGLTEHLNMTSDTVVKTASKAAKAIGKWGSKLAAKAREERERERSYPDLQQLGISAPSGGSFTGSAGEPADEPEPSHQGNCRALVAGSDGYVWAGHHGGLLERYTFNGCLQWSQDMGAGIRCAARVGLRLWVGLACGGIHVFATSANPELLAHWPAHEAAVVSLVQAGKRVFSLAHDGSIRGWSAEIPSPQDQPCREELERLLGGLVTRQLYRVAAMTWNVNEQRPPRSEAFTALSEAAHGSHVVAVGLQEMEVGGSSLAMAAAKDVMARGMLEKGNANAQWWNKQVLASLGPSTWHPVGLRQLSGMLLLTYAHEDIADVVGDVFSASVATGVLGVGGNKGAVALTFTLHRRRLGFIASHFAPHQGGVSLRNANYRQIASQLAFKRPKWWDEGETVSPHHPGVADASRSGHDASCRFGLSHAADAADAEAALNEDETFQGESMRSAEMLVWMGDLNYRIEGSRDMTVARIHKFLQQHDMDALKTLLRQDQLLQQKATGQIFNYLHEAPIEFPPTFKFDKDDPNPLAYDSSEKQRVPAWTDRILFRGSEIFRLPQGQNAHSSNIFEPDAKLAAEEIRVTPRMYKSVMGAIESDHKPVYATLDVNMPVIDQARKRERASEIMAAADGAVADSEGCPLLSASLSSVTVESGRPPAAALQLHNRGTACGGFLLGCAEGNSGQRGGLPSWLAAHPVRGVIQAGSHVTLHLGAHTVWNTSPLHVQLAIRVSSMLELGGPQPRRHRDLALHVTCNPAGSRGPLSMHAPAAISYRHGSARR